MNYRRLGKTGIEVSELGYGAWGIGKAMWVGADDDESLRALRRAIDQGVNFLDTALGYGEGHSEGLVGQAVRQAGEQVFVASKIPPKNMTWPAPGGVAADDAFPAEWVVECTEQSLANLGLDTIDVQQFHVWSDEWVGHGSWADGIARLREQGKIRFFGVSINDHQPANAVELVKSGLVDTVQVIYNIFDQSPEDELFPAVQAHGVGVIVRVPLDEGALTGRITAETTFPEGDWRHRYFGGNRKEQVVEHVEAITKDLGVPVERLPEIALRYCISAPAVSTVIPGMRSVRNVEANVKAIELGPLSGQELQVLHQHRWVRNFYNAP
ncbi:MAG TPA: aldo/keto reductase [Acidimicrobiales bacterium]|nr:aldo/keto reductase [Acidimicrobiales bacterium]